MPRKEDRKRLSMKAQCRTTDNRREISISDISASGCRLAVGMYGIPIDQKVVLSPRGLDSLSGTVKWCAEGYAGIEFDRPLHIAMVDHLCSQYPDRDMPIPFRLAA